jgi:urea transport system substrate-binding protein
MNKIVILGVIGIIIISITGAISLSLFSDNSYINNEQRHVILDESLVTLDTDNPIKIGILHSLSGTMAISESVVVDSVLLAVEEINSRGGILGREVIPIIKDGQSDWDIFADEAENLIVEEEVDVVFGGWTSASRKTMKPVFEEYNHLLFYPVQYEGLESSPNIIYTGAAPNQQVLPAIDWANKELGNKFFLVGSDYIFPRSAGEIMKAKILEIGGSVVGEEYKVLGERDFVDVVDKIVASNPDVILNTINGDSNIEFFKELRKNKIYSYEIPTISFSIAESEIRLIGTKSMQGDYASWNYFQSISNENNQKFVKSFQEKYGSHRVVADPMEAGYVGVYLYAKAVESVGSTDIIKVRETLKGLTLNAPEGVVGIDPENNHLSKIIRIGQILPNGQFKIVSSSEQPIKAQPYPDYKTKEQWNSFLDNLYNQWDKSWANPGL